MKKGKSITLLTLICAVLVVLIVMSFASFSVPTFINNGINDYNSLISILQTDGDVSEGYVYELTMKNNLSLEEDVTEIDSALKIIETRLDKLGYKNYSVTAFKNDTTDDYDVRIIVTPSYLNGTTSEKLSATTSDIQAVIGFGELTFTDADGNELFDAEEVEDCFAYEGYNTDESGNYVETYCCNIVFSDRAINILKSAQGAEETMTLAIKLGDEELFSDSSFKVSNVEDNSIAISGYSTIEQARQKALQIKTAGLMYEYEINDARTITPILGVSAKWAFIGIIIGIVAITVALFAVKYRGFALSVLISLVAFVFIEVALFIAIPNVFISASSLIGLILALIICCFMLYSYVSYVGSECANGKTLKAALSTAGKRTLFAHLDIGIVLEIIALALIIFATGALRDFAIAFALGIALAVFMAVIFNNWIIKLIYPLASDKAKFFNIKSEEK